MNVEKQIVYLPLPIGSGQQLLVHCSPWLKQPPSGAVLHSLPSLFSVRYFLYTCTCPKRRIVPLPKSMKNTIITSPDSHERNGYNNKQHNRNRNHTHHSHNRSTICLCILKFISFWIFSFVLILCCAISNKTSSYNDHADLINDNGRVV